MGHKGGLRCPAGAPKPGIALDASLPPLLQRSSPSFSDALCPFFSNVIEDHKTQYIPYSKFTCLLMVQCFTIYGVIMSVIGMFVALTQVDFMIIRIIADLVVNSHTTYYFLRNKEVDVEQYDTWKSANNTKCNGSALKKIVEHDSEEEEGSRHGLCTAANAAEETASHRPSRNVPV
jgi:hypothetical protein